MPHHHFTAVTDMHAHLRLSTFTSPESLARVGQAARAGGIRTLVCMPDCEPVLDRPSALAYLLRRAEELSGVQLHALGAITRGQEGTALAEMMLLHEAGAIGFSDAPRALQDGRLLGRALAYAATLGVPLLVHPESEDISAGGLMQAGAVATRLGLPGIPAAAEAAMVARDLLIQAETGGHLHLLNISTAASVDLIRRAKDAGQTVTCSTSPPYFLLTEACVGEYRTFAKLNPPLRTEADRQAVLAGLRDGTIDAIASAHIPCNVESKRQPFASAACGAAGLETLVPLAWQLVHGGDITAQRLQALLADNPRRILGLPAPDASNSDSITTLDPDVVWTIDPAHWNGKARNTPFDGMTVHGAIVDAAAAHA